VKFTDPDYDAVQKVLRDPETAPTVVPLDIEIADHLNQVVRADVPDMPDRIIAGTAHYLGLPLVTCDRQIQASGIATNLVKIKSNESDLNPLELDPRPIPPRSAPRLPLRRQRGLACRARVNHSASRPYPPPGLPPTNALFRFGSARG
jgi:hypothetical protein